MQYGHNVYCLNLKIKNYEKFNDNNSKQFYYKQICSKCTIHQVDKKGKRKNENLEYVFDEGELLQKRRSAIEKAQEIMYSFDNDESFSSPSEAHAKKFRNFKGYSIDIYLVIEDEGEQYDYHIYGDEEILYEALEAEAKIFKKEFGITKLIKIENYEDEQVEVIEESLGFFLTYSL